jgi:glutaredoxin
MKWLIRTFFKTIRLILGPVMLAWEKLATPKGVARSPDDQAAMDQRTAGLTLYQFRTCPFCIKVRHNIARHSLNIERRDAQHDPASREQLAQGGGQVKVPCLRISETDGQVTWLYESNVINRYLDQLAAT